ncbi:MAG: hypothetical protein H6767_06865 [Candidatus Peribacteria bacterium]|nr:MAG: hypothetical protein H6767_06865 [Candidatus Peribacteria bacterium]
MTTDRLSNRLNLDFIRDYLAYKSSGSRKSPSLQESFSDAFSRVARGAGSQNAFVNEPLISMDGGGDNNFAVELDTSGLENGDFSDVIKFKLDRTWPFPDFLMNWVTRQLEEIVTKLTDFPTLFVILPDFSGLFDNPWGKFADDLKKAYDTGAGERLQEEASLQ